jgi:hypothetical protein
MKSLRIWGVLVLGFSLCALWPASADARWRHRSRGRCDVHRYYRVRPVHVPRVSLGVRYYDYSYGYGYGDYGYGDYGYGYDPYDYGYSGYGYSIGPRVTVHRYYSRPRYGSRSCRVRPMYRTYRRSRWR